jgi:hypothetical protein
MVFLPGCTADAALSPRPETVSPALSRVDFCESGVTGVISIVHEWMKDENSSAYSSPELARQVPCVLGQTCWLMVGWLVRRVGERWLVVADLD